MPLAPSRLLVGGAVERDQRFVQRALRERASAQRVGDLAVDVGDRAPDTFAEVSTLVAVAKLERFAFAG